MSDSIVVTSNEPVQAQVIAPKAEVVEKKAATTQVLESVETNEESETSKESLLASEKDDESADDSVETEEVKPKVNRVQKKIDKLVKARADAEREKEYWKQEALKGKSLDKPDQEVKKSESVKALDDKPHPDNFETHAEFIEALTEYKLDQREKKAAQTQKETESKKAVETKVETFQSKVSEFKKDHDDFDDLIEAVDDIVMSLGLQESILESDLGPQLMYELAKDREEYERINKLGPLAAAREVGKIEARLSKSLESSDEKKSDTKKLTKAPAPMTPVGSKGAGSSRKSIYDPDISQADFEKLFREQQKAKHAY